MIWVRIGLAERCIRAKNAVKAWRKARFLKRLPQYQGKDLYIVKANSRINLYNRKWKAVQV